MTETDLGQLRNATEIVERPFRFGIVGAARSGEEWLALARRVEGLGFDTLLSPDTAAGFAPTPALAAAAAVTTTMRVGTYVVVAGLRPPRVLAWEAGSLFGLSGGRFELGLGAGRPDAERDAEQLGVPLGREGRRIGRVVAVLDAVRALEPSRRPPVLLAAGRPRMLALAGEVADAVTLGLPATARVAELGEAADAVRRAAREAGRAEPPELAATLLAAGNAQLPPFVSQRMGLDVAALVAAGSASVLPGGPTEMADELLRRRESTGISYVTAGAHLLETLAPVVERLRDR